MEPVGGDVDLKENLNIPYYKQQNNLVKIKCALFTIAIFLVLLFTVIIFLSFYQFENDTSNSTPKKEDKDEDFIGGGEINSIYEINNLKASLLSSEFENINNTIMHLYINEKKINFTKEYEFPATGNYNVKFILNSAVNLDNMFKNINSIKSVESLNKYPNSSLTILSMKSSFEGCQNLQRVSIKSSFDASSLKSMSKLFYNSNVEEIELNDFETKNLEDMSYMFQSCKNLKKIDISNFNTENVIDMSGMFEGCNSLQNLDISHFNTSKVRKMSSMFSECNSLTSLDVTQFITNSCENMASMFNKCKSLTSLDLHNFNTENVIDMSYMFNNCESLTELNLDNFDTNKVINMSYMLSNLFNLKSISIYNFETPNVKNMEYMFYNDYLITKINSYNIKTPNVEVLTGIFCNCTNLELVYTEGIETKNVKNLDYLFKNCGSLKEANLYSFNTVNCNSFKEIFDGCPNLIVSIVEKIENFENLLEVIFDYNLNIRFKPSDLNYDSLYNFSLAQILE